VSTAAPRLAHHVPHVHTDDLDAVSHGLVADLHAPRPAIFWTDMIASAAIGWGAFWIAALASSWSPLIAIAIVVAAFALYRGVCFTHELAHLRRRAVPGFETAWNILFGIPLLLPSFTYLGVHQNHHSLSTYGTKQDPEYLPFASSRRLTTLFAVQSTFLMPLAIILRFLVLSPFGLASPRLHQWLEVHASSFAMNPEFQRSVDHEMAAKMRRWEMGMLAVWSVVFVLMYVGAMPLRALAMWFGVLTLISFLNTARVLGAHEYDSAGAVLSRHGQLSDSIDTPGGPWTELWAPVGLRYHALHHYFPGIPYHNLGAAYRRITASLPPRAAYFQSTSPSLRRSLQTLYRKAARATRA
jgi:fatty acid desaturase